MGYKAASKYTLRKMPPSNTPSNFSEFLYMTWGLTLPHPTPSHQNPGIFFGAGQQAWFGHQYPNFTLGS